MKKICAHRSSNNEYYFPHDDEICALCCFAEISNEIAISLQRRSCRECDYFHAMGIPSRYFSIVIIEDIFLHRFLLDSKERRLLFRFCWILLFRKRLMSAGISCHTHKTAPDGISHVLDVFVLCELFCSVSAACHWSSTLRFLFSAMDPVLQYPSSPLVDYIFNCDSDSDSDNDSESDLLFPEFDLELSCGDCTDPISKGSDAGISQEVQSALATALSSQSLTPILKEELRCKIQLNRLLHGQEEITADFSEKSCSMSVDEIVKKNRKLEQNRLSAHKSRLKQKTLEENIKSRLTSLERHNAWLGEQVKSLRHACSLARQWLGQHEECLQHTAKLVYAGKDQPSSPSLSSTDTQSVGVQHLLCAATIGQGSNV